MATQRKRVTATKPAIPRTDYCLLCTHYKVHPRLQLPAVGERRPHISGASMRERGVCQREPRRSHVEWSTLVDTNR